MLIDTLAKSKRSSKVAVSIAFVTILAVAIYNWLVVPHATYLHAAEKYEFVVSDVAKQNTIIKSKNELKKKQLDEIRLNFNKVREKFFTADTAKEFFSDIEVIATQANCPINSINFLSNKSRRNSPDAQNSSFVIQKGVSVEFVCSYDNVINFFANLFNRPQLLSIRAMRIEPIYRDSSKLECEITFVVYIVKDKEILTDE